MNCGIIFYIIFSKCFFILQLFIIINKSLRIWWTTLLILDHCFKIFNSIIWLNIKSIYLSCKCFHKDLHTTSKSQHKVKCGFFLDIIVSQCSSIFKLFTSKNESLLIWWNTFFILYFSFYIFDGVSWFHIKCNCLSCQCFHKYLHFFFFIMFYFF